MSNNQESTLQFQLGQQSSLSDNSFVILGKGSLPYDQTLSRFSNFSIDEETPEAKNTASTKDLSSINMTTLSSVKSVQNEDYTKLLKNASLLKSVVQETTEKKDGSLHANHHPSWESEATTDEIQKKLDNLLKENLQLKETLNQNNLAMKQQFDTLVMWQEEVMKTHQNHKEKFSETRELVLKLRDENAKLKKQVAGESGFHVTTVSKNDEIYQENANLKRKVEDLQVQVVTLSKKEMEMNQAKQNMTFVIENLTQKLKTAESNIKQLVSDRDQILSAAKGQLAEVCSKFEVDNFNLKEELQLLMNKNEMLKNKCKELENALEVKNKESHSCNDNDLSGKKCISPNSEARSQIQNLFRQLEQERKKVAYLKNQLLTTPIKTEAHNENFEMKIARHSASGSKITSSNSESGRGQTTELTNNAKVAELDNYIRELDELNLSIDKQNERFISMKSWLFLAEENIDENDWSHVDVSVINQMKLEIFTLRKLLSTEQENCMEKKKCLENVQAQFKSLYEDYQKVLEDRDRFNVAQKKERPTSADRKQLDCYIQTVESLTAQLKAKDELLQRKEKDLEAFKQNCEKLQLECEEVALLRAQVEVYQTDFNTEREAREKLVGDKEELAADLRSLQRINEQLHEQLKKFENSQPDGQSNAEGFSFTDYFKRKPTAAQGSSNTNVNEERAQTPKSEEEEIVPAKPYSCFKCDAKFRELRQLEEHVEECLELSN